MGQHRVHGSRRWLCGGVLALLALTPASASALRAGPHTSSSAHPVVSKHQGSATAASYERLLVQQGLLIGLASNVLQSQMIADEYVYPNSVDDCRPLDGGGSQDVLEASQSGTTTTGVNVIYYDDACSVPYMVQRVTITEGSGSSPVSTITTSSAYRTLKGVALGTMTTRATEQRTADDTVLLNGLGTFHVAGLKAPVSLGLACTIAETDKIDAQCQGGVAQDFTKLHRSLGSVTSVHLVETRETAPVAPFAGGQSTRRLGKPGALKIVAGQPETLKLSGRGSNAGTTSLTGRAGGFTLFPPPPTSWTLTDPAHHLRFTVALTNATSRTLTGSLTSTGGTKKKLASFTLDRSGTGAIHYSHAGSSAIKAWVLTG